jgi:hypothetical protein
MPCKDDILHSFQSLGHTSVFILAHPVPASPLPGTYTETQRVPRRLVCLTVLFRNSNPNHFAILNSSHFLEAHIPGAGRREQIFQILFTPEHAS